MAKRNVRFTDDGTLLDFIRGSFERSGNSSKFFEEMPDDAVSGLEESFGIDHLVNLTVQKITVDPFGLTGTEYDYSLTITYEQ